MSDLALRSDLLMLIYDLVHTYSNTILKTDTWSNACWYLIYYTLITWFLTLISHLTLTISDLTLGSDLLMLMSALLQTDINIILNINIWKHNLISDLTLRSDLLMLIYDLLHTDINMILNTDSYHWSNIKIWITLVDV